MLHPNFTNEDRKHTVNIILNILGLTHRADTIVGDDLTRGVSGGERRRVTIGVELLKRCQLLVMDEATTGLDSTTSLQIFRALRIVADEMCPVFATLKQPGRELFELFDNIIVMHDGKFVYNGPREEMIPYFQNNGYIFNVRVNPADEVLNLVDKHGDEMVKQFETAASKNQLSYSDDNDDDEEESQQIKYQKYSQPTHWQFVYGVKRGFQLLKNNPGIALSRIIFACIMSIILGTLFLQLDNSQIGIQSTQGALFIVATYPAFQALADLPTVYSTRPVYYYQRNNNYYGPLAVLLADFLVSAPVAIVESILFSTVCYWLIGFNTIFVRYLYFLLMVAIVEVMFTIVTKIAGFILPSFQVASIVVPPFVFLLNFFTGFAITKDRAPDYLQWLFWVSPFRYLLEGLYINEFSGEDFYCEDDEFYPPNDDKLLDAPFSAGGYEGNQICPLTNGEELLSGSGFHEEYAYAWYWFLVLIGFTIVLFIILFITSFFQFKSKAPRDLRNIQEERERQNEHIGNLKTSLRHSIRQSSILSNSSGTELSDSENSDELFFPGLEVSSKGKRIDTNFPVYLEWKNIRYTVKVPPKNGFKSIIANLPFFSKCVQQDLTLVNDVSGYVKPGMLVAFLGPSGAGKTTLLDVLSRRKTAGKMEGEILINGAPFDPATLTRFAGYVEQQNMHIETETVEEALLLSANLRLCYSDNSDKKTKITRQDRIEHVNWCMSQLQLTPIRDALISELSLEQKKRLTIGVELAANPSLLWLDEPTSGLDSIAALRVMKAIKQISDAGVAVVCTLHQPSELIFSWCSHLLLLAPGGNLVYFGEAADAYHEAKEHFSTFGLEPHADQNPADFFLDCCSSDATNGAGETPANGFKSTLYFDKIRNTLDEGTCPRVIVKKQPWYKRISPFSSSIEYEVENPIDEDVVLPPVYSSQYARNPFIQSIYLITRNGRGWWRSPVPLLLNLLNSIVFGIVLALLFSELDDSQLGARENVSLYFFTVAVIGISVMAFLPQLFEERPTFYRETLSLTYDPKVYVFALSCISLPLVSIFALCSAVPPIISSGMITEWYQIVYYLGICVSMAMFAYSVMILLSAIASVSEIGDALFSIVVSIFSNGFLLISTEIPSFYIWMYWIGYQHYGLEGLLLNGLEPQTFYCKEGEGAVPIPVPSDTEPNRVQLFCPYTEGDDILDQFEVNYGWEIPDLLILVGGICIVLALASLAVAKVRHIKR